MSRDKQTPNLLRAYDGQQPWHYADLHRERSETFGLHEAEAHRIGLALSEPEQFDFSPEDVAMMAADLVADDHVNNLDM